MTAKGKASMLKKAKGKASKVKMAKGRSKAKAGTWSKNEPETKQAGRQLARNN